MVLLFFIIVPSFPTAEGGEVGVVEVEVEVGEVGVVGGLAGFPGWACPWCLHLFHNVNFDFIIIEIKRKVTC